MNHVLHLKRSDEIPEVLENFTDVSKALQERVQRGGVSVSEELAYEVNQQVEAVDAQLEDAFAQLNEEHGVAVDQLVFLLEPRDNLRGNQNEQRGDDGRDRETRDTAENRLDRSLSRGSELTTDLGPLFTGINRRRGGVNSGLLGILFVRGISGSALAGIGMIALVRGLVGILVIFRGGSIGQFAGVPTVGIRSEMRDRRDVIARTRVKPSLAVFGANNGAGGAMASANGFIAVVSVQFLHGENLLLIVEKIMYMKTQ